MAEDVVNGAQVNATIYYVLSQGYYSQVFPIFIWYAYLYKCNFYHIARDRQGLKMCHHSPECISLIHMNINHAELQIKGQASHSDISGIVIEIGEFLFAPQKRKRLKKIL